MEKDIKGGVKRAEDLVPGHEAIDKALADNREEAMHLRRLKKMRTDLDAVSRGEKLTGRPAGGDGKEPAGAE